MPERVRMPRGEDFSCGVAARISWAELTLSPYDILVRIEPSKIVMEKVLFFASLNFGPNLFFLPGPSFDWTRMDGTLRTQARSFGVYGIAHSWAKCVIHFRSYIL